MRDRAEPNYRINNPKAPEEEDFLPKPKDFSLPNRAYETGSFQGEGWKMNTIRYKEEINNFREKIEHNIFELSETVRQLCKKSEYLAERLEQIEKTGAKPTLQETDELQKILTDIEILETRENNLREKIALLKFENAKSFFILNQHNPKIEN